MGRRLLQQYRGWMVSEGLMRAYKEVASKIQHFGEYDCSREDCFPDIFSQITIMMDQRVFDLHQGDFELHILNYPNCDSSFNRSKQTQE